MAPREQDGEQRHQKRRRDAARLRKSLHVACHDGDLHTMRKVLHTMYEEDSTPLGETTTEVGTPAAFTALAEVCLLSAWLAARAQDGSDNSDESGDGQSDDDDRGDDSGNDSSGEDSRDTGEACLRDAIAEEMESNARTLYQGFGVTDVEYGKLVDAMDRCGGSVADAQQQCRWILEGTRLANVRVDRHVPSER